jgi:hypothetical protein
MDILRSNYGMDSILLCQMFNFFVLFLFIIIQENTQDVLPISCNHLNMLVFENLSIHSNESYFVLDGVNYITFEQIVRNISLLENKLLR